MASTGSKMANTQNANNNSNNSKSDTHELKPVASDVTAKQTTARSASSGRVTQESREAFLQRRRAKFEQHRKVFEGQQQPSRARCRHAEVTWHCSCLPSNTSSGHVTTVRRAETLDAGTRQPLSDERRTMRNHLRACRQPCQRDTCDDVSPHTWRSRPAADR